MWGAIIGAVAGGVAGGLSAWVNTDRRVKAYKNAAKALESAAERYTGKAAEGRIMEAGDEEGRLAMERQGGINAMKGITNNDLGSDYNSGMQMGQNLEQNKINGEYARAMADVDRQLKQAGIEANASQQMVQTGLNTAGGLADLWKNISTKSYGGKKDGSGDA